MRRGVFVLLGALALVVSVGHASAQDAEREHARAEFTHGVELYHQADYGHALASFQEAYRLSPNPAVRVNMANCYDHLDRPLEAIFHFEHYLSEAGANMSPEKRHEVETSLAGLRQRVGSVHLNVSPDGAAIRVDESEERRAPVLDAIVLRAGQHHLRVHLDGYRDEARDFDVRGGSESTVSIRLERPTAVAAVQPTVPSPAPVAATPVAAAPSRASAPAATAPFAVSSPVAASHPASFNNDADFADRPAPASSTESAAPARHFRLTKPIIVTGAVSVGLVAAAVVTGVLALHANSAFNADVAQANDPRLSSADHNAAIALGRQDANHATTLATVTDVVGGLALAGTVATVVMLFSARTSDEHPQATAFAPFVGPHSAGLSVRGTF